MVTGSNLRLEADGDSAQLIVACVDLREDVLTLAVAGLLLRDRDRAQIENVNERSNNRLRREIHHLATGLDQRLGC